MTKFMRSAASLCLASPVILACCGPAVCDEKALPAAEGAGGGVTPAPGKFSLQQAIEKMAKARGNRTKWLLFKNPHNATCFTLTGLLYASGDQVGMIVPNYAMYVGNVGAVTGPRESADHDLNPISFLFVNPVCRFTITITKFALRDGFESLVPPLSPNSQSDANYKALLKKLVPTDSTGAPTTDGSRVKPGSGVELHGDRLTINPKTIDPTGVGTFELKASFDSPQPPLGFSAMVWFGSDNFSLYIGNAPADMTIESRKNTAAKAYEIDISTQDARMRLSVRKDIDQDGSWIADFDD